MFMLPPLSFIYLLQFMALSGRIFTSDLFGRLGSDNRKSREHSYFSNSLKVKRLGEL